MFLLPLLLLLSPFPFYFLKTSGLLKIFQKNTLTSIYFDDIISLTGNADPLLPHKGHQARVLLTCHHT